MTLCDTTPATTEPCSSDPHETFKWLDAKQLGEWVTETVYAKRDPDSYEFPNLRRSVARWTTGASQTVSVWDVDRLLTPLDIHLWEIPAHIWVKEGADRRQGERNNPARLAFIRSLLRQGETHESIVTKVREAGFACSDKRLIKRIADRM